MYNIFVLYLLSQTQNTAYKLKEKKKYKGCLLRSMYLIFDFLPFFSFFHIFIPFKMYLLSSFETCFSHFYIVMLCIFPN